MHTPLVLLVAVAASAASAAAPNPAQSVWQARRVWKRGAGASWDQLALLASLNPYAALLGGSSELLHADALGLASAPPLYGPSQHFGAQHYGGYGLLNVAAAAPLAFNPYFARAPHAPAHRPLDPNEQLDKAINAYVSRSELLAALSKSKADKAVNTYAQTAILSTPAPLEATTAAPPAHDEQPFRPSVPVASNEPSRLSLYPQPQQPHQHMTLAATAAPPQDSSLKSASASYAASPRYPAATHPLFGAYGTAYPPPAAAPFRPHQPY